jgi:hypothetical protein
MITCIDEPPRGAAEDYPDDYSVTELLKERVDHLNRLVHADPIGAARNVFWSDDHGRAVQFAGANFKMPEYCDEIAGLAAGLTSILIWEMQNTFQVPVSRSDL